MVTVPDNLPWPTSGLMTFVSPDQSPYQDIMTGVKKASEQGSRIWDYFPVAETPTMYIPIGKHYDPIKVRKQIDEKDKYVRQLIIDNWYNTCYAYSSYPKSLIELERVHSLEWKEWAHDRGILVIVCAAGSSTKTDRGNHIRGLSNHHSALGYQSDYAFHWYGRDTLWFRSAKYGNRQYTSHFSYENRTFTVEDPTEDQLAKKRNAHRERDEEIRRRREAGESQQALAEEYGLSQSRISKIAKGE